MANTPLVGQSPVLVNYTPVVTITKVSSRRTRPVTVKKGAYGSIGSAKGQPQVTGSFTLAVPKAGSEIDLEALFNSDEGFTLTYTEGADRYALYGVQINEDDLNSDYEAGNTEKVVNFIATDKVRL
jgi:hypothetical protein